MANLPTIEEIKTQCNIYRELSQQEESILMDYCYAAANIVQNSVDFEVQPVPFTQEFYCSGHLEKRPVYEDGITTVELYDGETWTETEDYEIEPSYVAYTKIKTKHRGKVRVTYLPGELRPFDERAVKVAILKITANLNEHRETEIVGMSVAQLKDLQFILDSLKPGA